MQDRVLTIGLVVPEAGEAWMGGIDFVIHAGLALADFRDAAAPGLRLKLIFSPNTYSLLNFYEALVRRVEDVVVCRAPRPSLWRRVLRRLAGRWIKPRPYTLYDFAADQAIDFLYPCYDIPPSETRVATSALIPDLQHKHLPHYFSPGELQTRDEHYDTLARHCTRVIMFSQHACADFARFFPAHAAKARPLRFRCKAAAADRAGDPHEVQQRYHLPDRFFIVSNQLWQHKNHMLLLEALHLLQAHGPCRPVLVFTGGLEDYRKPEYLGSLLQTIARYGLHEQVRILGLLPKPDQIQLVRRAVAVVQPSLFEGLSLMVEIARGLGKAMILSDFPVHVDQNPPRTRYFQRTSAADLAAALQDYWETLQPGPDLGAEDHAVRENHEDVLAFGKQLFELGCEAVDGVAAIPAHG
jgi:glycosyltransferase involved in cell wall biosynthesis